jgi:hypothetical protein
MIYYINSNQKPENSISIAPYRISLLSSQTVSNSGFPLYKEKLPYSVAANSVSIGRKYIRIFNQSTPS